MNVEESKGKDSDTEEESDEGDDDLDELVSIVVPLIIFYI
jgi:hypothetical protein